MPSQKTFILKPVQLTVFFQRLSYAQEKEYSNIKLKEQSTLENLDTDNILDNIDNEFRALTMGQVMNARKICNIANLCSNESDPLLILKHSTKIQWILNFITKLEKEEKVVIASHFTKEFAYFLGIVFLSQDIKFCTVDGEDSKSSAKSIIDFKSNIDTQVMLLSTTSGGCGLTLTVARFIIIVDLDWNPACDKQAMARIVRIGQKRTPYIISLISHAKIDDSMFQAQNEKSKLSSLLMKEDNAMLRDINITHGNKDLLGYKRTTNMKNVYPSVCTNLTGNLYWKPLIHDSSDHINDILINICAKDMIDSAAIVLKYDDSA